MSILTPADIAACNHRRLRGRFILAMICVLALAPLTIFVALVGFASLLLFWIILTVWVLREILYAHFMANAVLVSELNYPRILTLSRNMKETLGVKKDFSVFVYEHGAFNAFMMRLFFRRAIFLNSEILEAGVSDDEVRWIIGRFVGYWRVQQDSWIWGWMIRMTQIALVLNFFILPYERAMVFTGDRLGLAGIGGDITTGVSAMQKLLVGRQLGYSINPVGIVEQSRRIKGSLFAFLARVASPFPHTITRYVDLIAFAKRRYPSQFAMFDAVNPGLPGDLDALSGERTAGRSILKGMLGVAAYYGGFLLILGVWIAILAGVAGRSGAALGNLQDELNSADSAYSDLDLGTLSPDAASSDTEAAAPTEDISTQTAPARPAPSVSASPVRPAPAPQVFSHDAGN